MNTDGNLFIYDWHRAVGTWGPGTQGHPGAYAIFQTDGNFVVYDVNGNFLWNSGTSGTNAERLDLLDDGRLMIWKSVWSSGTSDGQFNGTVIAHPSCDVGIGTGWTGVLGSGQCLVSPNGRFELLMQNDGNMVIYDRSTTPASASWASNTTVSPVDPSVAMRTLYTYDVLGNLTCVEQHGTVASGTGCSSPPSSDTSSPWRVRRFTYNSLSQLLTASNPESGQISYSYDDDGNMVQKTSPAPNQIGTATQTISYCYDALLRVTGKAYAAQSCPLTSPVISYVYDQGTDAVGRLSSVNDQAGTGSYGYDALGRLTSERRTIAGITKSLAYAYNLDGSLATLTYPSGAVVTYTPDGAGRVSAVTDTSQSINYIANAAYAANNSISGFVSGGVITNSFSYNKRLQPVNMAATVGSPLQTLFSINYDFHAANGDNGNVWGITNNKDATRSQTFTYDALNRLISARNAGTDCTKKLPDGNFEYWGNNYTYDGWGNLLQKTVMQNQCAGENLNITVGANNRIQSAGYGYDAAGNMTSDGSGHNFIYDAENRITGLAGYTYTYDADGSRVMKTTTATPAAGTLYWYASPGIVAESDLSGTIKSEYVFFNGNRIARRDLTGTPAISYYFSDHLKTASVETDAAGNIKDESDFYPWGGELQFTDSNDNHYKFTGKERDNESGLDNMGARFYSNGLGRFVTPDPLMNSGRPWDPQTWNRYGYAHNNPLSYVDPSGLYDWQANAGGSATDDELRKKSQNKDLSRKDRNAAKDALKFRDKFRAALAAATTAAAGTGDSGALAAYGSEGDHNGVNVGTQLGYGAGTILNKDDTISVNFGKDVSGNDLAVTVAHEGQHVEDGQAWVAAGHPMATALDMNHYERETRAWGVSARVAQALGMSHFGPHGGGSDYYVWNSSWHNVDRVNAAIGKIVHDLYHQSPGDTDRYSRENPGRVTPVPLDCCDRH